MNDLLTISEAIARSARARTESRGAHSRLDHPATDDKRWGHRNIAVARAADRRTSEEGQEGLRAFLEKRQPGWGSRSFS